MYLGARMQDHRSIFASRIAQTSRQWRQVIDARLRPFGLTEATWLPLLHVSRADQPPRQKDLAETLVLDGSSIVRLLDTLEAAGLVERRASVDDRRVKTIHLTPRATAIVIQVEEAARQVRTEILTGISDTELAAVARVLDRVDHALSDMPGGEA